MTSGIGLLLTETPLHCGVGQDIGVVDQPIQREKHTGWPIVYGSEIKGVLRDHCRDVQDFAKMFGPEPGRTGDTDSFAASLSFGEAHVLFFPVRSAKGTNAWVTSPAALQRFCRMAERLGRAVNVNVNIPNNDTVLCGSDMLRIEVNGQDRVVLEDHMFVFQLLQENCLKPIIDILRALLPDNTQHARLIGMLNNKACVVSDDTFSWFLESGTEIITRVRIDDQTGVVAQGALWTEEYIPSDTFMYFPVVAKQDNHLTTLADHLRNNPYIQLGGNETVGKGFVRVSVKIGKEE